MSGLLQPVQASKSSASMTPVHIDKKVGNKKVMPVNPVRNDTRPMYTTMNGANQSSAPQREIQPTSTTDPRYTHPVEPGQVPVTDNPAASSNNSGNATETPGANGGLLQIPNSPSAPGADYQQVQRPSVQEQDVRDNASVAKTLNGLLSQDNPYIQQARARADMAAASRGLKNSTMGVQAGEQAAIAQALPIAQQDAAQNFQLQQNEQMQNYQMDQNLYNAMLTGQRDQNQQNFELGQMEYQAKLQRVLNSDQHQQTLARMDKEHQMNLGTINQNFLNEIERMGVVMEHDSRMAYVNASSSLMERAMDQIGMIYANPNMTPEQQAQAVDRLMATLGQQAQSLGNIFRPLPGIDFEDGNTPGSGGNTGQPGTGGGNVPTAPSLPGGVTIPNRTTPILDPIDKREIQ